MNRRYFVGLDLGQANDYTAAAVLEEMAKGGGEKDYAVRHLERYRHVSYPEIVDRILALLNSAVLKHRNTLIIDGTGVGAPVLDMFRKRNRQFRGVLITGGDTETRGEDGLYRVPKRNLVSGLQILLQSERLKIAGSLELAQTLKAELLNFKVDINLKTTHDSYEAWREGDHDDLVLAAALAAWGASKVPPLTVPFGPTKPEGSYVYGFGQSSYQGFGQ
jgi:hypothetical protein